MTEDAAVQLIYARFRTKWEDAPISLPFEGRVVFDRDPFPGGKPPSGVQWARLSVRYVAGGQRTLGSIGNRRYARFAKVFVHVFTPRFQSGAGHAGLSLARKCRDIFEGTEFGGIIGENGRVYDQEPDETSLVHRVEVDVNHEAIK